MELSLRAKISLVIAVLIMLIFFATQTAVVIGYFPPSFKIFVFVWSCVFAFFPPFFIVVIEFVRKTRYQFQNFNDTLKSINNSNALVELDLHGNIISANKVFSNIVGYSIKELKGMSYYRLMDPTEVSKDRFFSFFRELSAGLIKNGEFKRITKDGDEVWIYGNYNPITDPYGSTYKILQIATNITDKKLGEFEIAKKNTYLEHAAKILRHDMHSGINTYIPRGLSSLKRRMTDEQIKELKIDAPLRMIEEGLIHTQKVYKGVKEFTNLVKKDAQLDKQVYDLKEILNSYFSSTSYVKQIIIKDLISFEVNEALFCTAIDNLVRNGLKYNDNPTKIVTIFMQDDSTLCIQDNGRGMSQEEFIELSKPYIRKENQKENGSGLGLNICIAIMEEHKFKVTVEKLEEGTKLKIKIK